MHDVTRERAVSPTLAHQVKLLCFSLTLDVPLAFGGETLFTLSAHVLISLLTLKEEEPLKREEVIKSINKSP